MKFHLLLLKENLDFGVFLADDFEKIFSEYLCPLDLTFIRTSVIRQQP